jgi:hypothetical protein
VSTSALVRFVRYGRERESISLYFGYNLVSKSVSLYFGYALALKREFPYTLGTFSVKERVYGYSGTIRTTLGTKNGVFTSALSDELGMEI